MFGAAWAQAELRKALGLAGARVLDQELAVPTAHEAFKDDGRLARGATRRRLRTMLADLIAEIAPITQATAPADHQPVTPQSK
jgi:chromate reductase, NAD(P)H dehydrogenase (quinone)